jgi:hypothetical protein
MPAAKSSANVRKATTAAATRPATGRVHPAAGRRSSHAAPHPAMYQTGTDASSACPE